MAFSRPLKALSSALLIPDDLRQWDGAITPEWIAAEGIRLLAAELPYEQFEARPLVKMNGQMVNWPHDARQFGAHFHSLNHKDMGRQEYSKHVIEPPIMLMANEIRDHKPKACYPLALPKGVEDAAVAISEKNGFSLRYLRVYDIREDLYVNRFDMLTA